MPLACGLLGAATLGGLSGADSPLGGALRLLGTVVDTIFFSILFPGLRAVASGAVGAVVGAAAGAVVGPGIIISGVPLALQKAAAEKADAEKAAEMAAETAAD